MAVSGHGLIYDTEQNHKKTSVRIVQLYEFLTLALEVNGHVHVSITYPTPGCLNTPIRNQTQATQSTTLLVF
jgi:hypothetical protein